VIAWMEGLNFDPQAWWFIPARAFTGDLVALAIWAVVVAVLFPLGVYIFSRRFVSDAAAASAMGQRKRVADRRVAEVRGGLMQTVVRKELRLLVRDPLLLSQIGLQLIYFLPLAFLLFRPGGGVELNMAAIAAALTLLSSTLAASLIWITVSAEDAPDLLISAPVRASVIDRAKLVAAVGPVWTLMAIPLVLVAARDPWAGGWAIGGVAAASLCAALVGLWRRVPGSRREFARRRGKGGVIAGLGQAFMTMGIATTVWLGATGLPWMAILPAIITAAVLGALYKPAPSLAA
jgi:ABC-2 type transport system permease protein